MTSKIAREFAHEFSAPVATLFCSSMIFGLNLLIRSEHHKNSKKLDDTQKQLENATTELSIKLDKTNEKIQSIDERMETMGGQIKIIWEDIRLAQIIAGNQ
ncbi:hypothetical protein HOY80DRAFT_1137649 [Tuber brumale]|nr:hypothetical protein HOY80DRAFT_1137649 [Tuber brumale]